LLSLAAWILLGLARPLSALGQEPDADLQEAYFRVVGEHFQVSLEEVSIIGRWNLIPDEVPVVLFLAHHAGVSPDALIGLRRNGEGWWDVGNRFGIQTRAFHLPLPEGADKGSLTALYDTLEARPAWEWHQIRLDDQQIITLVNLRVLGAQTGVPPLEILRHYAETGSFVACYARLLARAEANLPPGG
jgi:hypothetical protein